MLFAVLALLQDVTRDDRRPDKPVVRASFGCNSDVKDDGLAKLTAYPELEELSVISDAFTEAGLDVLRKLPKLRWLRLNSDRLNDRGLERLSGLSALRELVICRAAVTAEGLKALPALRSLTLYRVTIDDAMVARLKEMGGLERLTFGQLSPESRAKAAELVTLLPKTTVTFDP